jgi:glycosyltransferase involved in cell wall biosynthesis
MISVVLPVYRNEETLSELRRRLGAALAGRQYELLFVVDGSPDGSTAVLEEIAAGDPDVRFLPLARNMGQQRAIIEGMAAARGDTVVVMDADLQDPPEAIATLLEAAASSRAGAVFAGRRGAYESPGRLATSRLFKRINHLLCGVPADAGAFVLMRRPVVDGVLALRGPPPVLTSMIGLTGLATVSVPVERGPRPSGRSTYGPGARVRAGLRGVAWGLIWRFEPLRRAAR